MREPNRWRILEAAMRRARDSTGWHAEELVGELQ